MVKCVYLVLFKFLGILLDDYQQENRAHHVNNKTLTSCGIFRFASVILKNYNFDKTT